MPITVVCSGCSKRLTVKDELVGRRIKCPKCTDVFVADAAAAVAMPATPQFPGSRRPLTLPGQEKVPRLHVSKRIIALVAAAMLIPTVLFLWHVGPASVMDTLAARQADDVNEIKDLVDRVLQSHLAYIARFDPHLMHQVPHAIDVMFLPSPLYFSMPEKIGFAGTSTEGAFHGEFHLQSHEIETDVDFGGRALPGVLLSRGATVLHRTGRTRDGKMTAEIEGKPADLPTSPRFGVDSE